MNSTKIAVSLFAPINGWTKAKIKEHIEKEFKGLAVVCRGDGTSSNRLWPSCSYLTPEGKKCAVGVFIPNGHEGQRSGGRVESLLGDFPDLKDHMPLPVEAMSLLQDVHDQYNHGIPEGYTPPSPEVEVVIKAAILDWVDNHVFDAEIASA